MDEQRVNEARGFANNGRAALRNEKFDEAADHLQRALSLLEPELGSTDSETIRVLAELGISFFETDAYSKVGEQTLLRAIELCEANSQIPKQHIEILDELAHRYYNVARFAEAEKLYLRLLALQERAYGPMSEQAADTAIGLGVLYDHIPEFRNVQQAEAYYRKGIVGFEASYSAHHIDLLAAQFRLADLLHRQGRNTEAHPLFTKVIELVNGEIFESKRDRYMPMQSHWNDETRTRFDKDTLSWIRFGCRRFVQSLSANSESN